jgi:hypothetical protein
VREQWAGMGGGGVFQPPPQNSQAHRGCSAPVTTGTASWPSNPPLYTMLSCISIGARGHAGFLGCWVLGLLWVLQVAWACPVDAMCTEVVPVVVAHVFGSEVY